MIINDAIPITRQAGWGNCSLGDGNNKVINKQLQPKVNIMCGLNRCIIGKIVLSTAHP
jgi:hypothetical protein